ncbi:hypothetical protein LCGC14_1018530 [marine sediment metagenome]|uniref:Uncharacterized protein n=1 Tax=marine sediment metagenome TaxID=412755 RepID=A0A0F9QGC2_9ZZZZ
MKTWKVIVESEKQGRQEYKGFESGEEAKKEVVKILASVQGLMDDPMLSYGKLESVRIIEEDDERPVSF